MATTTPVINNGLDRIRFRTAIASRDESLKMVAANVGCSYHALYYALSERRALSKSLLVKLREHFGTAMWLYITCHSDTLPVIPKSEMPT